MCNTNVYIYNVECVVCTCMFIYIYMIMYHIRQNVVSAHRHKMCSFVCKTRAFSTLSQALTEVPYSLNTLIHSHM